MPKGFVPAGKGSVIVGLLNDPCRTEDDADACFPRGSVVAGRHVLLESPLKSPTAMPLGNWPAAPVANAVFRPATEKLVLLVAVTLGMVTVIAPVVAPAARWR